jgi:hypothetical protein
MSEIKTAHEDAAVSKANQNSREVMTRSTTSRLTAASWTARLAAAAALAIGILFAALAAKADPLTTHPRMWITQADLPKLRGWAVDSNPMYKNGLAVAASIAKADVDAKWNWAAGKPNCQVQNQSNCWQDDGSSNFIGEATEAYAEFFAFMSLVDPNATNRTQWAKRSHIMLMWAMNQAVAGISANQPFRDPSFSSYNRANYWGEAWPLTVDWIYPSLTSADKATIRTVFKEWANHQLTVSTAGNEHPQPVGVYNSPKLLGIDNTMTPYNQQQAQVQLRWAANNYFLGHMRELALMSMSIDAADDPPDNAAQPVTKLGNTLRSYFNDMVGAWLYQSYSLFEDAATVRQALKVTAPNVSLGIAAGGLPVEGSLYGESLGFLGETLLAMRTAGYDNTKAYGPQAGLFSSTFWDKAIDGFLSNAAPIPYTPPASDDVGYLGQLYQIAAYGDMLRSFAEPDSALTLSATVGISDEHGGNAVRLEKARWSALNIPQGGPAQIYQRAGSDVWGNSYATDSILYFLLFDPAAGKLADPRPSLPTKFIQPGIGRILARTDWSANSTWFTYRCSWESINHQSGDCGQFELYRKGQWLIKQWDNYANDELGYTPLYHNILSIQNDMPANLAGSIYSETYAYGGQWNNDGNDGDADLLISVNDNWAYSLTDATNLYNSPDYYTPADAAMDVKQAVRSIVWLNPDYVVVYDRATTGHTGRTKQLNLDLVAAPSISGSTATAVKSGQKVTIQSLLPAGATIAEQHFWKTDPSQEMDRVADLSVSTNRLVIADPKKPADTRFLTVVQGTDSGVSAATAAAIHSTGGTPFDGAVVANTAVVFPVTAASNIATTTFSVPSTVTRILITGLQRSKGYDVTITPAGDTKTVTAKIGTSQQSDDGGVIGIGFPASKSPTQTGYVAGFKMLNPM